MLLLTLLTLSTTLSAATYRCRAAHLKVELNTDSPNFPTLLIQDVQTGQYYYNGVASTVTEFGPSTKLKFETDYRHNLELQFKTSAYNNEEERLFGFINGQSGGGLVNESFQCIKRL